MKSCKIVQIETPNKFLLNGLWFGPERSKKVFIYVHGLGGSVFAQHVLLEELAGRTSSVLTFNNRGSGIVTKVKKLNALSRKGYESSIAGQAHEIFTECIDDIEGAVRFAERNGAKNIFLMGHSTGCQKSVYYLSKKRTTPIKGLILMAPLSDYAYVVSTAEPKVLGEIITIAKKLIEKGHPHKMIPTLISSHPCDAQRFLSLYTPDNVEEIFCYATPSKTPTALNKIKVPLLVILADEDEYNDRPTKKIADWFKKSLQKQKATIKIIRRAPHNFRGHTKVLKMLINGWIKSIL